jgi:hypothetical protein
MTDDIASLLAQWHEWRRGYSVERKHARVALAHSPDDEEETLNRLFLGHVESEIERLPADMRLALQHVARTQSNGVEVVFNPRLPKGAALDALCERSVSELRRRLLHLGLL